MKAPTPHLCLSGFMGTGKTTVGRIVADRAGVDFFDLDAQIERMAGQSVAEIFRRQGEGAFRTLEHDALAQRLAHPQPTVIALGGGTLARAPNRRLALARARVITLIARPETSIRRLEGLSRPSGRPLLTGWPQPLERAAELLEDRRDAYAEAHATVDTESRTPANVAEEVFDAWSDRSLLVPLGRRSYSVRFARDLGAALGTEIARLAPTSWFLVSDETVAARWLPALRAELGATQQPAAVLTMKPGESQKTLAVAEDLAKRLVDAGADRGSALVALGGGVVSDLTGFVAATLFRGIRWLCAPTSCLAMVDAAVGGKTGVDLPGAKNAVGAFHQPSAVLIRIAHVETESARAYRSGLAEAVKAGAIGDSALLDQLVGSPFAIIERDLDLVETCVRSALAVKTALVSEDEREGDRRALLNFGHTYGHAIEAAGGFARWTHGESVALGMAAACELGVREAVTDEASARRLLEVLRALGLPTDWRKVGAEMADYLHFDKKRRGESVRVVLLRTLGDAVCRELALDELRQFARAPFIG